MSMEVKKNKIYYVFWQFKNNMPMPESHTAPALYRLWGIFFNPSLIRIDFVISNFLCQNVQTTVGGGGVDIQICQKSFFLIFRKSQDVYLFDKLISEKGGQKSPLPPPPCIGLKLSNLCYLNFSKTIGKDVGID